MKLVRLPDPEAVAQRAADAVRDAAQRAIAERGAFALALAGGDTPRQCYERLARASGVDWRRVAFFFGDERAVPPDHPDSNYAMARAALLAPLEIPAQQVHRIEAERADLDAAARDYERGLPLALDLVMLGVGTDGHTASLFPHSTALAERSRRVVPNQVPHSTTRRVTITLPVIASARALLVLVTGEAKAAVLAEVLEGPLDADRLPSQHLRDHAHAQWLVDAAAARQLVPTPDSAR